ncbi:SCP-like protein [Oesophagostomum dentatum]|uniref:SCP-like protein n=1 Tax=Oesophagostomum dentatum TaxID=61180 RepID=A0A0B1SZF7_OESDE|nr:SCP-like protein [Oesophagostomum dentatum]
MILNMHNEYRSLLARGQTQVSAGWGIAPPAAVMYRMKYDCDAESYAQQAVSTCSQKLLPPWAVGGYKQNIRVMRSSNTRDQAIRNIEYVFLARRQNSTQAYKQWLGGTISSSDVQYDSVAPSGFSPVCTAQVATMTTLTSILSAQYVLSAVQAVTNSSCAVGDQDQDENVVPLTPLFMEYIE